MLQDLRRSKVLMRASDLIFNRVISILYTLEEIRDLPTLFDASLQRLKHMARNRKIIVFDHPSQIHQLFN